MKKEQKFFHPFVGEHYTEGINGKKILVLGANFYCNKISCPHFVDCTSVVMKDSSKYDKICPEYMPDNKVLHMESSYCIEDAPQTYQRFAAYIGTFLDNDNYDNVWNHMAFTNYVQFMLPASNDTFRETTWSDLSERDFDAFIEVLQSLKPDIVIVWGNIINSRVKERNKYLISLQELQETEYYICHLNVPNVCHPIAIINPYHPSSNAWYGAMEQFDKYFTQLLER